MHNIHDDYIIFVDLSVKYIISVYIYIYTHNTHTHAHTHIINSTSTTILFQYTENNLGWILILNANTENKSS